MELVNVLCRLAETNSSVTLETRELEGAGKVSTKQNHKDVSARIRTESRVAKPTDVNYSQNTRWTMDKVKFSSPDPKLYWSVAYSLLLLDIES